MTTDTDFKISWEWQSADSVRTPEHRATWARIEMKVGSDCITLVEDRASGSSRRSIYCPLYPLAEWVAYNWWFLQAHTRPSQFLAPDSMSVTPQPVPQAVRDRHSIRASGDGFAWPDLLIVPDDDQTRLVWGSDRGLSPNWPIRFLTHGDTWLSSEQLKQELEGLITETLTRLAEQGIRGSALETEWTAIQNTDPDEVEYCKAAARLGLDPYSEAEPFEQVILRASEILSGRLLYDFLNAVSPDRIDRALSWVSLLLADSGEASLTKGQHLVDDLDTAGIIEELQELARRSEFRDAGLPWNVGYQQAKVVRRKIAPDSTTRFAVDRLVAARTRRAPDISLQALGIGARKPHSVVIIGQSRPATSTRFTLTRALWHRIWDNSPAFVITTARTRRQQIERAFAAELLAPAEGVAQLLESPPEAASQEELEQIAQRFGVSSMVIEHQVRNHLIGSAA